MLLLRRAIIAPSVCLLKERHNNNSQFPNFRYQERGCLVFAGKILQADSIAPAILSTASRGN